MKNNIHSSKRVIQYDTNIAIVNQFPSIAEAERITKIPASNICKTLKGVTSTAGGFYWSYVDNKPKLNVMAHKKIIYQIDVNGNVINRFGSIKEASIEINRDPSSIQKALDIPNRKSGAYRWVSEIKSLK